MLKLFSDYGNCQSLTTQSNSSDIRNIVVLILGNTGSFIELMTIQQKFVLLESITIVKFTDALRVLIRYG